MMYKNILKNLCVLYIEDEAEIRLNVKKVLSMLCKEVIDTDTVEKAKEILSHKKIDIIISDINLPNTSGLEFTKELRQTDKTIPIVILSAFTSKEYLLEATKLKLVDYLTKPIDFKTLNAALKKCVQDILDNGRYKVSFGENIYNVQKKSLFNISTEEEIPLTSKEMLLLEYLIENTSRVVSHDELKNNIWEDEFYATDSALKNLLNKLRKKIGKDSIKNISGIGFRLDISKDKLQN